MSLRMPGAHPSYFSSSTFRAAAGSSGGVQSWGAANMVYARMRPSPLSCAPNI